MYDRVWHWRKFLGERKGQLCRIVARGSMNAALIEFSDGSRVVSSRWAIRKAYRRARREPEAEYRIGVWRVLARLASDYQT
jgi:hypothetical protein